MIHKGKLLTEGKLEDLRAESGQQDLDDIFVTYVNRHDAETEVMSNEF